MQRRYNDKLKLESLIGEGENSKGFTAQTPNGTAHWKGTGWNGCYDCDHDWPQKEPSATAPAGRSNRTGE